MADGDTLHMVQRLPVWKQVLVYMRLQLLNRPISVYRSPRRALTRCPQLCMGIQPGARFPARSADALPAILYWHFTQAIYRNRPITLYSQGSPRPVV